MNEIETRTVILAGFDSKDGASTAIKSLKKRRRSDQLVIDDAVALRKDARGKIRVSETADWSGRKGMVVGGIAGAAVGVVTGGIGWLAMGGAAATGLTSRLRDSGFNDQLLREVTEQLDPNSSAMILVCDSTSVDACEAIVRQSGARSLVRLDLDVEVTADLMIQDVLEVADTEKVR